MKRGTLVPETAIAVCGMAGVGKTSLLREMQDPGQRCVEQCNNSTWVCDVVVLASGGSAGQVTFYDLAGSPGFLTGRIAVYAHAFQQIRGIIFVFDIAERRSFDALETWYRELDTVFPLHDRNFVKILVGNKLDRQMLSTSVKEMENWADARGFRICLTAAVDGRGVSEICPFVLSALEESIPLDNNSAGEGQTAKHEVTPEQVFSVYRLLNGENDWERLGVPVNSNMSLITKAYRKIAAQIHPDKCPLNRSEDAFKLLSTSKDALAAQMQKP
ncbi:dnaJ homolog subfamily C member 27-like isoform X2 [Paramacrobiotus metropolitanus]|uniref:dnaJ homolog subfamily C member 27-like isoform X2 n=1 Tax=Paramacrobiotus metropolitanus TaxID=2943436 RepID=UPI002445A9AE|nr:dnaJ homolog subfamily C member 27-like isoform X2 [Paramacrobiotus metropolitanus]